MPDTSTNDKARTPGERSSRGVKLVVVLLSLLLIPAGIYALYVVGQLGDIRRHDLRGLDATARAAEGLLDNVRTTVANLIDDQGYACAFFLRQTRLRLVEPSCEKLTDESIEVDDSNLRLEATGGTLQIVGRCGEIDCLRIEVALGALLEQIPFGAAFDQLLVADEDGDVLGSAITPRRDSPMLPPRASLLAATPSIRTFTLTSSGSSDSAANEEGAMPAFATLTKATEVRTVDVGGARYALMCQPWRVKLARDEEPKTWRVCGLKDSQESFRRALEVAPYIVIVLLAFLTFAIVSWPILKILSLAPEERIRFVEMYLTLLATLGLTMLLSAGIADVATHATVRERSHQRLQNLAIEIDEHLRSELVAMRSQLVKYDGFVVSWLARRTESPEPLQSTVRIGCLLLPPMDRPRSECDPIESDPPLILASPDDRDLALESVFWMRPCDGWQILKGSSRFRNTPPVRLDGREYFRAIKRGQPWRIDGGEPVYIETATSITTGEFFTALSIESDIAAESRTVSTESPRPQTAVPDCTNVERRRFAAALSGQPVSMRYPVLAPGVGFAIVDQEGDVLYHSDERRAAADNVFTDDGLAPELRAALATASDAHFRAYYQTRPHDVYVHPMSGFPWAVVTFVDGEVLRSFHVELLGRVTGLIAGYLLLALLATLLYMAVRGREPPMWMWPRHGQRYRPIYHTSVAGLALQLAVFLVAIDYLQSIALLVVCVALPMLALATVHVAGKAAKEMAAADAMAEMAIGAPSSPQTVYQAQRTWGAWIIAATVAVVVVAAIAMLARDRLSTSSASLGIGTIAAIAIVGLVVLATRGRAVLDWLQDYDWWKRWGDDPLTPHVAGAVLMWLLIGAVPAAGLFELALARETVIATKLEQGYVARAHGWQACRKQEDQRLVAAYGAANPGLDPRRRDVYDSARLARLTTVPSGTTLTDDARTVAAQIWQLFAYAAPVYNESTIYKRYLDPLDRESDSRWAWSFADPEAPALVYDTSGVNACGATLPVIASRLPSLEPEIGWFRAIGVIAFLVLLVAWVSFSVRKLFFGDIEPDACRPGRFLDPHLGGLGSPPTDDWIKAELEPIDSALAPATLFADRKVPGSTRRAVVDCILDRARPLFQEWWKDCSAEEKLVLVQLVEEGFANPKQGEIVRRLLRKGRLRRDPVLRPVNHSFAVFVDSIVEPADLERETPHRGLRLTGVRGVLLAALVLVLLFLSITQQETVQVWVAYLTTTAAGAFGVLKLMSFVSKPSIKAE